MGTANWYNLLSRLSGVITPRSAEAEVHPLDKQSADLINATQTGEQMPASSPEREPVLRGDFDPRLRAIMQAVLKRAQERPETATIQFVPPSEVKGRAQFNPNTDEIKLGNVAAVGSAGYYRTLPSQSLPAQDSLAHELTHFLYKQYEPELKQFKASDFPQGKLDWLLYGPTKLTVSDQVSTANQHRMMDYLLGGAAAPGDLQDYNFRVPFVYKYGLSSSPQARMVQRAFMRRLFSDNPALLEEALKKME